jgi:hypothetical protein
MRQIEVAHQPENGGPASLVVVAQAVSALDRESRPVQLALVLPRPRNVLGEASGDVSDGAHPERQEVRAGTRSIAHEIPPKPPLSGRARQLILLLSEVVEADPPVPAAGERLHRHLEETELVVTPGE